MFALCEGGRILQVEYPGEDAMKKITVASVQMLSENGNYEGNHLRAERLILDAVRRKAKLVLIPEFALAGYIFSDEIWDMGEPLRGRTYHWLKGLCEKHRVFIGACVLEREGDDFYDTFILCGPGKDQLWSHRKIEPASCEAYFFRGGGVNPNVFDTPLGRVGVSICFDSAKIHTVNALREGRPDIVLIPYSCPELPGMFLPGDRAEWLFVHAQTPRLYAGEFGVPVIASNKTGPFSSPLPWMAGMRAEGVFAGGTSIIDRDGTVLASLKEGEGVVVAAVRAGAGDGAGGKRPLPGRWFLPYGIGVRLGMEISLSMGVVRYRLSLKRRRAARAVKD
jgi:N-carbamoylputrescine amidase